MEGLLFEVNVETLDAKRLANLVEELKIPAGAQPHFKAAHTAQGRLVVANNTYEEAEYLGERSAGRLAGYFDSVRSEQSLWNADNNQPVAGGWPVLTIDTSGPVDVADLARSALEARPVS